MYQTRVFSDQQLSCGKKTLLHKGFQGLMKPYYLLKSMKVIVDSSTYIVESIKGIVELTTHLLKSTKVVVKSVTYILESMKVVVELTTIAYSPPRPLADVPPLYA